MPVEDQREFFRTAPLTPRGIESVDYLGLEPVRIEVSDREEVLERYRKTPGYSDDKVKIELFFEGEYAKDPSQMLEETEPVLTPEFGNKDLSTGFDFRYTVETVGVLNKIREIFENMDRMNPQGFSFCHYDSKSYSDIEQAIEFIDYFGVPLTFTGVLECEDGPVYIDAGFLGGEKPPYDEAQFFGVGPWMYHSSEREKNRRVYRRNSAGDGKRTSN